MRVDGKPGRDERAALTNLDGSELAKVRGGLKSERVQGDPGPGGG